MEYNDKFLYIKKGRKNIESKKFDFETLCLIDDKRNENCGIIEKCLDALFYVFEGTAVTVADIKKISAEQLTALCAKLFLWYNEILLNVPVVQKKNNDEKNNTANKLRSIYVAFLKSWGILPSYVAVQSPELLFKILSIPDESDKKETLKINQASSVFYGM